LCPGPVFRVSFFGRARTLHGNGIRLTSDLGFKATSRTITSCGSKEDLFDPAYAPQARTAWKTALTSGDGAMAEGTICVHDGDAAVKAAEHRPVMAGRVFDRKTLPSFSHQAYDDHPSPTGSWGMIKPYRAQVTQRLLAPSPAPAIFVGPH
jgi:hypothetical protein